MTLYYILCPGGMVYSSMPPVLLKMDQELRPPWSIRRESGDVSTDSGNVILSEAKNSVYDEGESGDVSTDSGNVTLSEAKDSVYDEYGEAYTYDADKAGEPAEQSDVKGMDDILEQSVSPENNESGDTSPDS